MTDNKIGTWLALATVLAFLGGAIAACDQTTPNKPNAESTATSTQAVVSPSPLASPTVKVVTSGGAIADLSTINKTADKQSLAEKQAQLTNLNVKSVVGDRTFWVTSNNEQLFVLLAPPLDEGSAEQKIVVKTGQTIELKGVLKKMPTIEQAEQQWGLSPTEAEKLKNQALYLQAEQIKFK